ncbi:hypothetical protein HRbin04_00885 [archaeon HR04]|nr:hypothetical protein HRbin04_00885 [archaeon HR04]
MLSNEELKKRLLDMLEQDKDFRYAVAGAIGYKEILDKFVALEERMNERFAKVDERFASMQEEMDKRFLELRKEMNERFAKVDERFAKVEEDIRDLRKDLNDLRKDMQEGFKRVDKRFERMDMKITALGARWGIMNEESVREALKGIVGEELGYTIGEWSIYDDEGYVYGYPSSIQLDIVISDGKVIALELASHVKRSDPFTLKKKVELYRKKEGKEVSKIIFVTPFIDDDARDACNRLGIEVYTA